MLKDVNVAYLPSKPPLMQGLHLKFLLKEVNNLPKLTLSLILIILEPIGSIVVLIKNPSERDDHQSRSMEHREGKIYVQLGRQIVHLCKCQHPYLHHLYLQMESCGEPFDIWSSDACSEMFV